MSEYEDHHPKTKDKFGEDIAFGIQQTVACWATDFIDPFVSAKVQGWMGDKNKSGTLKHAFKGEVVGDTAAFFIFLAMQKVLPQPVEWLTEKARKHFDTIYDKMARNSLSGWAQDHNLTPTSERYQHKLEEWKQFQASSFAKSAVISIGSVVSNVAMQKWSGNQNSIAAITISKAIGAGITSGVILGSRLMFPQATSKLDKEMDRNFISPLIHKTQRLFGAKETSGGVPDAQEQPMSFAMRLTEEAKVAVTPTR